MTRFTILLEQLRERVHGPQQAVGRQIFENYGADITTAREGDLRAGVDDGRQRHKVKLKWDDRNYSFSCSCGTHESRVCEHVWAAVLTANEDEVFTNNRIAYANAYGDEGGYYDGRGY